MIISNEFGSEGKYFFNCYKLTNEVENFKCDMNMILKMMFCEVGNYCDR